MGGAKRPPRRRYGTWLGVVPFFVFSAMFLIGPTVVLAFRSLEGADGSLTFDNYRQLTTEAVMRSYGMSIRISLTSAVIGGIFGFLLAWAVSIGGLGRQVRSALSRSREWPPTSLAFPSPPPSSLPWAGSD